MANINSIINYINAHENESVSQKLLIVKLFLIDNFQTLNLILLVAIKNQNILSDRS
jgi:hypothetical protein